MNTALADYGGVLRSRWRWIMWGVVLALVAMTVFLILRSPLYRSKATVFVRTPGDVSKVLDGGDSYVQGRHRRPPNEHVHRACRRQRLNRAIGARRTVFAVVLAIVLIGQLVTASAFTLAAARKAPQPWPLSIAVVGDSYTAGSHNRVVWPTLLAQRTGWSVSNFALPDAGFVADGQGGHAFTYQVDRAQGAHPRIIVIVGGLADDGSADTGPVSIGAIDAINKIKVGGQRALVIGPTWYQMPVPASVTRVSDAVRKVAEGAGVPYLDALDPPWLTPDQMQGDLSGPTDEGQSVIADKIAAWLRIEVAE